MSNSPGGASPPPVNPAGALSAPPPPPGPYPAYPPPPPPSRRAGIFNRIITGLVSSVLLLSIFLNVYFGIFLFSMGRGPAESTYADGDAARRIVILPVQGMIGEEEAEFVRKSLKELRKNKPEALVLRVDSPGGTVAASDRIWHELKNFRKDTGIPVVASYGSLAASGGYYISAQADYILAEPTTITGSIGVIAEAFTIKQLLDKVGVKPQVVKATGSTKKDVLSPFRDWEKADTDTLQFILDEAYTRFVDIVAEGRKGKLDMKEVQAAATGEPFTCKQALEKKLIDEEGYLDAALDKAKALAKIDPAVTPRVTILQRPQGLADLVGIKAPPALGGLLSQSEDVRQWAAELATPRLEYRMAPLSQ